MGDAVGAGLSKARGAVGKNRKETLEVVTVAGYGTAGQRSEMNNIERSVTRTFTFPDFPPERSVPIFSALIGLPAVKSGRRRGVRLLESGFLGDIRFERLGD